MTQAQFEKKIKDKLASLKVAEFILPFAVTANTEMSERIFEDGKNASNAKIGNYSTEEMYAGVSKFNNNGAFRPQGKSEYGKKRKTVTVFDVKTKKKKSVAVTKQYRERKTMFLKNGYKELRAIQGYESSFVNLQYTGDLMTDFTKVKPIGEKVIVSVSRGINDKKIQGLENRYGRNVFRHTKEEKNRFTDSVTKALIKYLG